MPQNRNETVAVAGNIPAVERYSGTSPVTAERVVTIPLRVSVITGILIGGLAGAGAIWVCAEFTDLKWWHLFGVFVVVVWATVAISWLMYCPGPKSLSTFVANLERVMHTDLDNNGQIGSVGENFVLLNPNRGREVAAREQREAAEKRMYEFVKSCKEGGTSERWLKACGFDVAREIYPMRDMLIEQSYGFWRSADHRQGWDLAPYVTPEFVLANNGDE